MKANMTHQPQEVLIKVMCSERLPSKEGKYIADLWLMNFYPDIDRWYRDGEPYSPEYWYEPATRIVLTEEEYMDTLTPVTRTTPYPDRERIRMELWKESFLACQGDDKSGFATYALAAFDKQFPK